MLASGSADRTILVWDLTEPSAARQIASISRYTNMVYSVAFQPNGKLLASGSSDKTTLWDLSFESSEALAWEIISRNFTDVEWERYFHGEPYQKTCPIATLKEANAQALKGEFDKASAAFAHAVKLANDTNDARLNNSIGWYGSIDGFAKIVLPACERAVKLASDHGQVRDTRGLARALTGDYSGAIEDFESFVRWSKENNMYEPYGRKREAWIAELRKDRNPFDRATLRALRQE
jgi:tetratricopeptide (TPR) repeat protein